MPKEKRAYILYTHLSEEFVRRGIGSNYFSELAELYHLAEVVDAFRDSVAKLLTDKIMLTGENARLKADVEQKDKVLKAIVSTLEPFLTDDDDDPAVAAVELAETALQTKEE